MDLEPAQQNLQLRPMAVANALGKWFCKLVAFAETGQRHPR